MRYHAVRDDVLCLERTYQQTRLLIALNFSGRTVTRSAPEGTEAIAGTPAWLTGEWQGSQLSLPQLSLPPYGVAIARCSQLEENAPWGV